MGSPAATPPERSNSTISQRLVYVIPLVIVACMAVALAVGLTMTPRELPSALIGKPAPDFDLPPVQGRSLGLASSDLAGEVSLVNVFASWCAACRAEHPLFIELARSKTVPIHGLNYKDKPDDAARWLDRLGDPYTRTGADRDGRVGIDWGVYGVPETYVVNADGQIAYKHIGALTPEAIRDTILPFIEHLREQAGKAGS